MKPISITPKANANQLYSMRLQMVPDGQPSPSPGMNTMVTIYYDTDGVQTLYVPSSAILHKDGKTQVFVYAPDSRTVRSQEISVMRLLTDGRSIITADELKPGELVVSSGVHHIKDGDAVKPLPAVTQTNVGGLL